jgi:hypothetical protein
MYGGGQWCVLTCKGSGTQGAVSVGGLGLEMSSGLLVLLGVELSDVWGSNRADGIKINEGC